MVMKKRLVPLDQEVRAALPTAEAAEHLSKSPATLRNWAIRDDSPIQPLRVGGRLAWPTSAIKRALGVA